METILVPTDFSPTAENAVNYAVELAKFFKARLILLHAYPFPAGNIDAVFPADEVTSWQNAALERLENLRIELLAENEQELDITCLAEMGSAYDVIDAVNIRDEIDLIVMGIVREAGKIKEHIIGSSAVKVARHLETPVFIIPEGVKYQPIHRISFACDMDKTESTSLINMVRYFSRIFKAELEIVNIENPLEEVSFEKAKTSVFIEKNLENVKHKTVYVTENKIAKGLENYFESQPTDLIILNPKKHNLFHALFKENVTNELAFHVHVPILAIH